MKLYFQLLILILISQPLLGNRIAVLSQKGTTTDFVIEGFEETVGDVEIKIWVWNTEDENRLSQEVTDFKPQLVLCMNSDSVAWAKKIQPGIPIIAAMLLKKAELSGQKDVSGVYLEFPLKAKLAMLSRQAPTLKSIGILHNPEQNKDQVEAAVKSAAALDLKLQPIRVPRASALPSGLQQAGNRNDAMIGIFDNVVLTPGTARAILGFSLRNRVPFVGVSHSWVKAGALFAFDRDYTDYGRQLGDMARQVLDGTDINRIKPGPPRKALLGINMKTAKRMKLKIPQAVVEEAHLVIE